MFCLGVFGAAAIPAPAAQVTVAPAAARPDTMSVIVHAVSAYSGVSPLDLLSERRSRDILRARQVAMYLARREAGASDYKIAVYFKRDPTTVLHAIRKIEREMESDLRLRHDVERVRHLVQLAARTARA
jgi:chromosomal replication initiator protein